MDILSIVEYYLSEFAAEMRVPTPSLTPEAVAALEGYAFRGNVRELMNIIENALIVSKGAAIQTKHLRFRSPDAEFFGILSVLLWCNTTYATILKPLNMAKLVEKSSLIVQGQVSDIRSAWNGNQTMILTEIDITLAQANAVLKGEQGNNTVTLKLRGGIVSDRTTVVLGNPSFSMNENVLLFLRPGRRGDFNGFFRLVGMAQGKYRVENGVAKRDLRNIAFVGANRPERLEEQPLANLRADIAQEVLRQDNQRQDQR